jgi:hypothetical protein
MIQAKTATPRAAEMPETVLTQPTCEFGRNSRKTRQNGKVSQKNTKKKSENRPFWPIGFS